jgi:hypothetical protein
MLYALCRYVFLIVEDNISFTLPHFLQRMMYLYVLFFSFDFSLTNEVFNYITNL